MNYSKSLNFNIYRCDGATCASESEIDYVINRLSVKIRASQSIIKFDTANKTDNLRESMTDLDSHQL